MVFVILLLAKPLYGTVLSFWYYWAFHPEPVHFDSLTITYGTSTSSSVWSSAVTSKMIFFW